MGDCRILNRRPLLRIDDAERAAYDRDGVVCLRGQFDAEWIDFMRGWVERAMAAPGPFGVHASLHGMSVAHGPWFLIEEAWSGRCERLMTTCREATADLGYELHDVDRRGEKGFVRLAPGFTTRPDSRAMARYFRDRGDEATAALFRPSSMETIRALGGDALTLVSEMPLFLTPGVGEVLGPPDPQAVAWKERIDGWRARVHGSGGEAAVNSVVSSRTARRTSRREIAHLTIP